MSVFLKFHHSAVSVQCDDALCCWCAGSGLRQFLVREGMKFKAVQSEAAKTMLTNTYQLAEAQAVVESVAMEAMSRLYKGLYKLGVTYSMLQELDLSSSLAVMAADDYASLFQGSIPVHPQGHAALTQQALPISMGQLMQWLFPKAQLLLPNLQLLHYQLVKVSVMPGGFLAPDLAKAKSLALTFDLADFDSIGCRIHVTAPI